jgi:hypothetical protein
VTSIQQGPRYVGARKKIPPLGANCPQAENHGATLLVRRNSHPFYNSLLSPFFLLSLYAFTAVILYCGEVPGQPPKNISKILSIFAQNPLDIILFLWYTTIVLEERK